MRAALPLLILLIYVVQAAVGDPALPSASCASLSGNATLVPPEATWCELGSLDGCWDQPLSGPVLLTGSPLASVWDVAGDAFLNVEPGGTVTISCLTIENVVLEPIALETLLSPPFLRTMDDEPVRLTLRDVEMHLSCESILLWQAFLCGTRLPGLTKVVGQRVVIEEWQTPNALLERVTLTCDPGDGHFEPACDMQTVHDIDDILRAAEALQDPNLPLVLTLTGGLDFGSSDWPDDGLRITANVTLSAALGTKAIISFGLRTVLFQVDSRSSAVAFLSFRGCILLDLPLSYLPLDHPRRAFGILSTGLWPVYREQVAMGLYNCTLILTKDEFKFWSFWLSILISPIPSVRELASWSFATGVELEPSGSDYIMLASYYGRYTTLVDVRYEISSGDYKTQQRNNILQITGDAQVPPTVVFQVRDSDDLLDALATAATASAPAQYGQYMILTENITMTNVTGWPKGGAFIRYPTIITTWPSSYALFDLQLLRNIFATSVSVAIKNTVLMNLAVGADGDEFSGLTSGLWAFNVTNWRTVDQQRLSVENAAMVVTQQEVEFYLAATVAWDGRTMNSWVTSYKVNSYDKVGGTWVHFTYLSTLRFTAQNVNITSSVPKSFDMIPITLPATPGAGMVPSMEPESSGPSQRQEILLFALLAITLPTALGAALVTFLFLRRRRISQMCGSGNGDAAKDVGGLEGRGGHGGAGSDAGADVEDGKAGKQEPTCCLYLPLRRSKYVNPLYAEPGESAPDVLLTGVLGAVACGRAAAPPAQAAAPLLAAAAAPASPAALMATDTATATDWSVVCGSPEAQGSIAGVGLSTGGLESVASQAEAALVRLGLASGSPGRPGSGGVAAAAELQADGAEAASGSDGEASPSAIAVGELEGSERLSDGGSEGQQRAESGGRLDAVAACAAAAGASFGGSPASPAFGFVAATSLRSIEDAMAEAAEAEEMRVARRLSGSTASSQQQAHQQLRQQQQPHRQLQQPQRQLLQPHQQQGLIPHQQPQQEQQNQPPQQKPQPQQQPQVQQQLQLRQQPQQPQLQQQRPQPQPQQPESALADARLAEMQRLEQLRRDIGDRHLEVHHSLGWGGCGVVYKGTWKGLPVAVKTVLVQGDSRASRQFLTEAAISASLQHANIVTTYLYELRPLDEVDPGMSGIEIRVRRDHQDHHHHQDLSGGSQSHTGSGAASGSTSEAAVARMSCWKLYIVQEYCELGTLKVAVDQGYFKGTRGGLPNLPFLLTIALDMALGLQHVHSKGVVHGDITVSNVLLQTAPSRPQGCIAKVADFGLSVKFEAGQSHHSEMYGGTPHYMAPERMRGHLSKRSDVYSLGVCLWEMYCGTPCWRRNAGAGAHGNNRRYDGDGSLGHSSNDSDTLISPRGYGGGYGGDGGGGGYGDDGGDGGAAGTTVYGSGSDVFNFPRSCPLEYSLMVRSCLAADPERRPSVPDVIDSLQRLHRRYG